MNLLLPTSIYEMKACSRLSASIPGTRGRRHTLNSVHFSSSLIPVPVSVKDHGARRPAGVVILGDAEVQRHSDLVPGIRMDTVGIDRRLTENIKELILMVN